MCYFSPQRARLTLTKDDGQKKTCEFANHQWNYHLYPGSKKIWCRFAPSPSWTFHKVYTKWGPGSNPLTSYPSVLCFRAAQDHQDSVPDLHRAMLSYHYNVRQQHSGRASCFPSKGKYTVLAQKKLTVKYLAVCFPWKWAITQSYSNAFISGEPMSRANQFANTRKAGWVGTKLLLPFRNNGTPFLSIFLSFTSHKFQKPQNALSTLN